MRPSSASAESRTCAPRVVVPLLSRPSFTVSQTAAMALMNKNVTFVRPRLKATATLMKATAPSSVADGEPRQVEVDARHEAEVLQRQVVAATGDAAYAVGHDVIDRRGNAPQELEQLSLDQRALVLEAGARRVRRHRQRATLDGHDPLLDQRQQRDANHLRISGAQISQQVRVGRHLGRRADDVRSQPPPVDEHHANDPTAPSRTPESWDRGGRTDSRRPAACTRARACGESGPAGQAPRRASSRRDARRSPAPATAAPASRRTSPLAARATRRTPRAVAAALSLQRQQRRGRGAQRPREFAKTSARRSSSRLSDT